MHRNLAHTLVAAAALAAGLSQPARAGAYGEALAAAMPRHADQRDAFTGGARSPDAEPALLPVVARGNLSVCRVRGFDASQDGMRKADPYIDGAYSARMGRFDAFTGGAPGGSREPHADGARSDARGSGECLS
ncbi:hypothetical protein [Cupriavidus neocaledonicus]|uniref:Uncharacterized protein n=1 Tax=Cupriavidus neocaledonicus TaxID=1040979 RepID=A0A375H244_9BURK|nr:hypothetical protein [Cupriavidus neocaledonicus]SOZ37779.1 conserved exported hypothetical protein [Cupriavidus neocaledonicus]SPD46354.1 conserved exported protein of unknown function [Cupriavidus neocaledonicus]